MNHHVSILVNGGWTEWTQWSACDKTCGGGSSYRRRQCTSPPPQNGGKTCPGNGYEVQSCNSQGCPGTYQNQVQINESIKLLSYYIWPLQLPKPMISSKRFKKGRISLPWISLAGVNTWLVISWYLVFQILIRELLWVIWSHTITFSFNRFKVAFIVHVRFQLLNLNQRFQYFNSIGSAPSSRLFLESDLELSLLDMLYSVGSNLRHYFLFYCIHLWSMTSHELIRAFKNDVLSEIVNGGWSAWSQWSSCSKSCDGQRTRQRSCTNPPSSNQGASCPGLRVQSEACNVGKCPGKCKDSLTLYQKKTRLKVSYL